MHAYQMKLPSTYKPLLCVYVAQEDQGHLPHTEHVQLGHDPALPDSRVLVSCGRPGRNTEGSHEGNGKKGHIA